MQLHPLDRSGVLPLLVLNDVDVIGIQLDVLAVPGGFHLALDTQPHAGLDSALQALGLLGGQVLLDCHGVGIVRHVEAQTPHAGPPGLPALEGEHLACHGGSAHFHIQILHGAGPGLNGVTHQHLPHRRLAASGGGGRRLGHWPGGLGRLTGDVHLHLREAIDLLDTVLNAPDIVLRQRGLHQQVQHDAHGGLIDTGPGQHGARQLQPQLPGELQLGKHFKKGNVL